MVRKLAHPSTPILSAQSLSTTLRSCRPLLFEPTTPRTLTVIPGSIFPPGFLAKLTLQIPWSSLGSKAAIIRIDGVYLVAGPKVRAKVREAKVFAPEMLHFKPLY